MMNLIRMIGVLALGIPCIIWDLKRREVPLLFLLGFFLLFFLFNLCFDWLDTTELILGILLGLFLLFVSKLTKQKIGYGDSLLYLTLGVWLGGYALLSIGVLSCGLGSIIGIILLIGKKKKWKESMAFCPFIIIAAVVEVVLQWVLSFKSTP